MKPEDAEEYTQALGQVVAGGWRQIALAQKLGVPKALGLSLDEWVNQRIGGYVKLSIEERRRAVAEVKADNPGMPNTEVAEIFGIDETTVRRDRAVSANAESPDQRTKKNTTQRAEPSANAEPIDAIAALTIAEEARKVIERERAREERKRDREQVQVERAARPLPLGKFRLLYADPPWRYEHVKTESRAVENQYPTLSCDDICCYVDEHGRAVSDLADEDAVLFLWTTSPKLAEAMQVIAAWQFTYRTCAVWDKEVIGMGYYFRQQHELLLVATCGDNPPIPEPSLRLPSVFRAKRSEHSEKPTFVHGYLEAMYPTFTKTDRIELFSREELPTWTSWGNEPNT